MPSLKSRFLSWAENCGHKSGELRSLLCRFYQPEQGQQHSLLSLGDSSYQDISIHRKNLEGRISVNKDQKCFPWYFNLGFFPFFLSSFWCLCWNPTPQKDVLPRLNSKYFFNEYWCAWLHFLSSYWNSIYPHPIDHSAIIPIILRPNTSAKENISSSARVVFSVQCRVSVLVSIISFPWIKCVA